MGEWSYFSGGLAFCVAVIVSIISILHRRLTVFLTDLAEGEARAKFWTVAIEAWFFLYSITGCLQWKPQGASSRDYLLSTIALVKDGLVDMSRAIILVSIGLIVFIIIRQVREQNRTKSEAH